MAIVAMQKVAILAHKSVRDELLEALHKEGVVEVSEATEPSGIDHTEVQFRSAELKFAITTLTDVASKETLAVTSKGMTEDSIIFAANHTDVRQIVDTLHILEKDDTEAEHILQELAQQKEILEPWLTLSYALNESNESQMSLRITGSVPEIALQPLLDTLSVELPRTELQEIHTEDGTSFIVAHIWKEDTARFEELATASGWTDIELPALAGLPASAYEEANMQTKELLGKKRKNHDLRVQLSVELPNLVKTAKFLSWLDEKQATRETMVETASTITLLGWMPKKRIAILEVHLQKISKAIAVLKVKADEGEEVPILLKNAKLLTPFESVTNLYGLPLSHEMDPTRALSPFFILYFALCLTDAGYGALIAIIFGTFLWKTKKTIEEARLQWLLFFAGIVTFFISIPFGGWLGFTPAQVPSIFTKETADGLLFRGQIWDLSAESGITFLQNLSLFLGMTHLFFGMYLAGAHKWIHGRKVEAFWQDFTSHFLLGAVLFMVFAPEEFAQIGKYTFYGVLALFIWGKGYGSPWFTRPLVGVLGLMNFTISLISNGLSYLRILALGLVTGALAAAVNQVAVEMGNLFPIWLAIPIIILIFVIGHLVSIALNTLGSFIHSGRLQFIEFFSQFFDGGGRPFSPFKRTT
jgi:V/A-type H+-transporting ATPase subunit I